MIPQNSADFLPGRVDIVAGAARDYRTLQRFHYLPTRPATWAAVAAAWYHPPASENTAIVRMPRLIGVAVLSWPSALNSGRNRAFDLARLRYGQRIRWANENVRTISRVVVHPQFRSIGLSHALIDWLCDRCTTRYIEASARMGRAHPMFDRAGFHRIDPADDRRPLYYWREARAAQNESEKTNPISGPNQPPATT